MVGGREDPVGLVAVPSSQVKEKYVYEGIRQIGLEACGADPVSWKGWER